MKIPLGIVLIFFSLASFYYFNQKRKIKKENRKDRLEEKREQLLTSLRKSKTKLREGGEEETSVEPPLEALIIFFISPA